MERKVCSKCGNEKDLSEYYLDSNTGKHRSRCKLCFNEDAKKYRSTKKDRIKEYSKAYRELNNELIKSKQKEYRTVNKDIIKERQKINSRTYYLRHSETLKEKSFLFRTKNPDYYIEYRKNNREYSNVYQKTRKKHDPLFKLIHNIRVRTQLFLNKKNISKNNSTYHIVGCAPGFLKEHIEKQFTEGMSWDLMGKEIHIDHIIPLSSAKTEEEIYKLCHYTNLQPLWAYDNLSKGDKIIMTV
jgi:hypothetical protein